MFFRRVRVKRLTFEERIRGLRERGFDVYPLEGKRVEVRRADCAAIAEPGADDTPRILDAGLLVRGEMAALIDGGFQKFLETPSGIRRPALAEELKALHEFQEDIAETLGIESLYHESLGTVCDRHAYDRLAGRA
jgi:hypothetical protein